MSLWLGEVVGASLAMGHALVQSLLAPGAGLHAIGEVPERERRLLVAWLRGCNPSLRKPAPLRSGLRTDDDEVRPTLGVPHELYPGGVQQQRGECPEGDVRWISLLQSPFAIWHCRSGEG